MEDPFADLIERSFRYHPPTPEQVDRYNAIRSQARELAHILATLCPASAERTLAVRHLQEAVMWANASIAINEAGAEEDQAPDG